MESKLPEMQLSYKSPKRGRGNTQDAKVAAYLNSGRPLTQLSALVNLDGCARLAARVHTINCVLAVGGYPQLKSEVKRTFNGHRYNEYRGFVPADVMAVL